MREEWLDEGGAGSTKGGVKEGLEKREGLEGGRVRFRRGWIKEGWSKGRAGKKAGVG